ncbi:protein-L-isoaspartate(D-aspartate) O-methyltransferase [Cesiribacter andamanensis]|uniref:Protein-L-isoaspartate O-methyltransferase n=1 Tax=Cesiribacter andamanensis AMV16 TaxID=1279009 RepID=M7MY74_9BACT|nr:protein-L-isoaspartate(D-aspartate) O-methyltransferase [Cesiribacter andamanensis]EMR01393.1 Protein-L-isoaspartate O-methyltransferase [Cesiribacter andamanensis AMV16]
MLQEDSYRHKGMRRALGRTLAGKGIRDTRVLDAIMRIPRHFFFERAFLEHAYQDKAFPIGEGQTISQPYTVAFQTELLALQPGDRVLEIGTGSGYQCCVLLEMGVKVYTIEYIKKLHERARAMLSQMGYGGATFVHGDGSRGLPAYAPYDKIIVTAGAPTVPHALLQQLRIGGVLVIPVGDEKQQKMLRLTKESETKIRKEEFNGFSFVKLRGEQGWDAQG